MKFKGVHPDDKKAATAHVPIEELPVAAGDDFFLSLTQHIGAPAKPLVKKGQEVRRGELIAEAGGFISAAIHSPVDGVVLAIDRVDYPLYGKTPCIVIKAGEQSNDPMRIDVKEKPLADIAKQAGIVGMGGAMFPAHVKLSPKEKIDTLIINGAECEPYLTCDHRLMLERPADLVAGALMIKNALNIDEVIFAVEANKPDAAEALSLAGGNGVEVMVLPTLYPQGSEKQLILSVIQREVPEGKLPAAVGVLVHNISTVLAVFEAVTAGMPLITRVVTLPEGVNTPKNILAPLGTPLSRLIDFCGGMSGEPDRIVLGGPMTGFAVQSTDVPVYKGMNGVLIFHKEEHKTLQRPCIRCGRCVRACPSGLSPVMLEKFSAAKDYGALLEWKLLSCIECSACNYVCPSTRPLKTLFRLDKKEVQTRLAAKQEAKV